MGLEGIVSKRIDAPYRSGPCKTWLKRTRRARPCSASVRKSGVEPKRDGAAVHHSDCLRNSVGRKRAGFQRIETDEAHGSPASPDSVAIDDGYLVGIDCVGAGRCA
jgi:hypothetical protein